MSPVTDLAAGAPSDTATVARRRLSKPELSSWRAFLRAHVLVTLSSHTNDTTHPRTDPATAHDQRREPVSPRSSGTAANTPSVVGDRLPAIARSPAPTRAIVH
jgi:hypothetical protein